MSEEDGSVQDFSDNYSYDIKSPSNQQNSSQNDMFEDEVKEDRRVKKNRQCKYVKTPFIPSVAVSEKIVICIDATQDMALGYTGTDSNKITTETLSIMKEALRVFFKNKLAIAKDTTFALVSVTPGNVQSISNFSSDIKHLVKSLSEIKVGINEEGVSDYDVTQIFSDVFSLFPFPENHESRKMPPEFLVRIIFVYNNSYSIPRCNEVDKVYTKFLNSPYCIVDIVYLHEAKSEFNNVQEIFDQFSKIISPRSYLFECSRNVTQVFNTFAKLLAHPYQRVNQGLWDF